MHDDASHPGHPGPQDPGASGHETSGHGLPPGGPHDPGGFLHGSVPLLDEDALAALPEEMLLRHQAAVQRAVKDMPRRRRAMARDMLDRAAQEIAERTGVKIGDFHGPPPKPTRPKPRRPAVAKRYRHPTDGRLTWNGQGKKPPWLEEALISGRRLEEFDTHRSADAPPIMPTDRSSGDRADD